jgi:branched-chain amino acid aminotransferase
MKLAQDLGYEAEETTLSMTQFENDVQTGKLTEVFACGTAAVITPVGQVKSDAGSFAINGGETGPVASRVRSVLLEIQHGHVPDPHGWVHRVL